jgi:hypothetical protein
MHGDPLVPTLRVGMPSRMLRVLCRAVRPVRKTTQSIRDGIPTGDRGNEIDDGRRTFLSRSSIEGL